MNTVLQAKLKESPSSPEVYFYKTEGGDIDWRKVDPIQQDFSKIGFTRDI